MIIMEKFLIARHYVGPESGSLKELEVGLDRLSHMIDNGMFPENFNVGLKLTIDGKRMNDEQKKTVAKEVSRRHPKLWYMENPEVKGSGTSLRQILFNPSFQADPSIVISADIDQYITGTRGSVRQIEKLTDQMIYHDSLMGLGVRSCPVVLGVNERASQLRQIHELFHSRSIGTDNLIPYTQSPTQQRSFAEIGECATGFYAVNTKHSKFTDFMIDISRTSRETDLRGPAADFYMVATASQLSPIMAMHVETLPNVFYSKIDEETEIQRAQKFVENVEKPLSMTSIAPTIRKAVEIDDHVKEIARFYKPEDVEIVRRIMAETIGK